ncbi:MAG: hypothetical protein ABIN04_02175 [Ginsengibacter sp.]
MQNFKNKLYNYETPPPEGTWEKIADEISNEKVIKMPGFRRRSKFLFYGATAAAALIIIFASNLLFNKPKETKEVAESPVFKVDKLLSQKIKDSINLNHHILETIINAPKSKKLLAYNSVRPMGLTKKYITIAGPEGQPVKISPKVATLIVSADNEYPPKPVWNKKIDKWQQIMLTSTLSPTSTNLMDMLQTEASTAE